MKLKCRLEIDRIQIPVVLLLIDEICYTCATSGPRVSPTKYETDRKRCDVLEGILYLLPCYLSDIVVVYCVALLLKLLFVLRVTWGNNGIN